MNKKIDAYSIMGFPVSLELDEAEVRARFQELSKSSHPDAGGDQVAYQRLVEAQKILSNTARRLRHWVDLAGWTIGPGVQSMAPATGESFARVASIIKAASEARRAREKAGSVLAKAMAECRCLESQEKLSELLAEIERSEEDARHELADLSKGQPDPSQVVKLADEFSYLEKWRKQAREALAQLV